MAKRSRRKREGIGPPPRNADAPQGSAPGRRPAVAHSSTRRVVAVAAVAGSAVIAAVAGIVFTGHSSQPTAARTIRWSQVPHLQTGPAPWSSGSAALSERLEPAGLHALTMEGAAVHIHQHLDLFVNRKKIPVPASIGIGPAGDFVTEIHTHDATGIIHVESPTKTSFTLGQLFCEWGVRLTASCLGRYRGPISWWVDGRKMTGNPAQLVLEPHQEIVVAAGRAPSHVPDGYAFPAGF